MAVSLRRGARCGLSNLLPGEEIIIDDGRAMGVRPADERPGGPRDLAKKAVISAAHIKPTFLKMIGPKHSTPASSKDQRPPARPPHGRPPRPR